ncbi:MAG: hypothetical protein LBK44_04260 [Spirochaetales bacterium]|nr:hypothetical protein [Spirochaetales bacterium]
MQILRGFRCNPLRPTGFPGTGTNSHYKKNSGGFRGKRRRFAAAHWD